MKEWDEIEQSLFLIRNTGGQLLAPREYALKRPKGISFDCYYEGAIPPRKSEEAHKILEEALRLRKEYLQKVEKHIQERKITGQFLIDWGHLHYADGLIMGALTAEGDAFQHARAGKAHAKKAQRYWVAQMILAFHEKTKSRLRAEEKLVEFLSKIRDRTLTVPDEQFPIAWFENLLSSKEAALRSQYQESKFSLATIKEFVRKAERPEIPPTDLALYRKNPSLKRVQGKD